MKEKIKSFIKSNIRSVLVSFGIVSLVILCMYHSSCHITPEGITVLTDNYSSPKIEDYNVDGSVITVYFTKPVEIEQCFVVPAPDNKEDVSSIENFLMAEKKIEVTQNFDESRLCAEFTLLEKTEIGKYYDLYSVVRDPKGSTLSFALPFCGENDHFPRIVISEINEAYSKKDGVSEYIELYALTSGNLFGLELTTASDGKCFLLPNVEVKKGEYIVVHLRKNADNKNAVSELESNLSISKAPGSVTLARDLWIENEESSLNATAEIVLLNNKQKNALLDCLLYCKKEYADANPDWKTEQLQNASRKCIDAGLWNGEGKPSDAVFSTVRKSISYISRTNIRKLQSSENYENNRNCWTGTSKSKMSPGRINSW